LIGSPGFDRVSGHPGQFFFKKKLKRHRFSKKNKKQKQKSTGCNRVFDRVTPGFSFLYFFFNPARFQPRVSRAGFQNYGYKIFKKVLSM
jgi:hypothetical protein